MIRQELDACLRFCVVSGALAVLLLPAARGHNVYLGWLPLWLLGMPLVAWWSFAWLAATQAGFAFAASAAGAGAACLTSDTSPQLGLHGSVVACFPPHGCLMPHISNAVLLAGLAIAGGAAPHKPRRKTIRMRGWRMSAVQSRWIGSRRAMPRRRRTSPAARRSRHWKRRSAPAWIPPPRFRVIEKIGAYYYNFWKDAQHQRGLWRRTTLDEYRKPEPAWETVLDLDALNTAEGTQWVWHGANCLRPKYQRCLIALSPGGSDADVTREFDLTTKQFVQDGFFRPEAKGGLGWIDENTVYVFTDFGAGLHLTSSGYPRMVKQWTRGTPLASAKLVYAGKPDDMYISALHDDTPASSVISSAAPWRSTTMSCTCAARTVS